LSFSLFSFQYTPKGQDANAATEALLEAVNTDGRIYLTQTTHEGKYVIRVSIGQFETRREDVMCVPEILQEIAGALPK